MKNTGRDQSGKHNYGRATGWNPRVKNVFLLFKTGGED
jgi:hypothetical protein